MTSLQRLGTVCLYIMVIDQGIRMFKCIVFKENVRIWIDFSLTFVPDGSFIIWLKTSSHYLNKWCPASGSPLGFTGPKAIYTLAKFTSFIQFIYQLICFHQTIFLIFSCFNHIYDPKTSTWYESDVGCKHYFLTNLTEDSRRTQHPFSNRH